MQRRRPTHRSSVALVAAALIHVSRFVAGAVTGVFGLVAAWHRDADWLLAAGLCGVVWLVFAFLHAFEATRARCALCSGSLFGVSGNSKSRRARRLLGSYPLHTAVQILASSIYRCQHCGEEIACRPEGPPEPVHGVVGRFGGGMEGGCIPLSRRGLEQGRGGVIRARGLTGEGS